MSALSSHIHNLAQKAFGRSAQDLRLRILHDKSYPVLRRGIMKVDNRFAKSIIALFKDSGHLRTIGMSGILRVAEKKFLRNKAFSQSGSDGGKPVSDIRGTIKGTGKKER